MEKQLVIKNKKLGEGKPLICIPIMEQTKTAVWEEAKRLVSMSADMIEWRVDAFEHASDLNEVRDVLAGLEPLVKDTILVYTFRSARQGGLGKLDADAVSDLHEIGAESNAVDFVDVEFFAVRRPRREIATLKRRGVSVIASHHDFEQTPPPETMRVLLQQMKESGADIVKLAVMPQNAGDVLSLLQETAAFHEAYPNRLLITMAMGGLGCISRVAGEVFGSCVTFGSLGKTSAPGQLPAEELKQMLDVLHRGMKGDGR